MTVSLLHTCLTPLSDPTPPPCPCIDRGGRWRLEIIGRFPSGLQPHPHSGESEWLRYRVTLTDSSPTLSQTPPLLLTANSSTPPSKTRSSPAPRALRPRQSRAGPSPKPPMRPSHSAPRHLPRVSRTTRSRRSIVLSTRPVLRVPLLPSLLPFRRTLDSRATCIMHPATCSTLRSTIPIASPLITRDNGVSLLQPDDSTTSQSLPYLPLRREWAIRSVRLQTKDGIQMDNSASGRVAFHQSLPQRHRLCPPPRCTTLHRLPSRVPTALHQCKSRSPPPSTTLTPTNPTSPKPTRTYRRPTPPSSLPRWLPRLLPSPVNLAPLARQPLSRSRCKVKNYPRRQAKKKHHQAGTSDLPANQFVLRVLAVDAEGARRRSRVPTPRVDPQSRRPMCAAGHEVREERASGGRRIRTLPTAILLLRGGSSFGTRSG